jgi:aspartyl-tRNA synthetase
VFEGTEVKAFSAPCVKAVRLEGGSTLTRSKLDTLTDKAKQLGAKGLAWFRVTSGSGPERGGLGLDSPLDRFLSDQERSALIATTDAAAGDLILVVADQHRVACTVLGQLRVELGSRPVSEGPYRYVWIVDFPMFDGVDANGNPIAAHHPFTMPHLDDLDRLESDPASVRSQAYDLVLNGWELGSGSVRIHRADIQRPSRGSGSCSGRFATEPHLTPVSPSGSIGWWPSLPAKTASARSSPSPRPSRGRTP